MRVHFIKGRTQDIAFFCDTLEIKKVTAGERALLESQCSSPEYEQMEAVDKSYLSTLILHISNACNMRCKYCFANHGKYGSEAGLMSVQTALDAIDVFYGKYKRIKQIKFFGGEPLLNPDAIEAVCRKITGYYQEGRIPKLPEFKTVTNGTIMPQRAMEVIRKYNIQTVFSIDGPDEIHDHARIMADQNRSSEKVRQNFRKLREYTGGAQPRGVEVTYTAIHREHGYSMQDLTEFFVREYGLEARRVNISPVSAEEGSEFCLGDPCACQADALRDVLDTCFQGKTPYIDQKLYFLIKKLKNRVQSDRQVCNAGWNWIAVSSSGDVYPCLMFVDRKEYRMGSIYEDVFSDPRWIQLNAQWSQLDRMEKSDCKDCFCNRICVNCMGQNEDASGSVLNKTAEQCDSTRRMMEYLIEGIAEGVL